MTTGNRKVAVLGAGGMLGTDVVSACRAAGFDTKQLDIPEFDITDSASFSAAIGGSDIIINCAAYTNVEKAESEPALAYKVNAEAVGRLGEFAKSIDAHVLHISTDFVFDGTLDKPYVETDKANPINAYGKSKLAGEQALIESGCRFCIVRLEWTYGSAGANFATKLFGLAKAGRNLKIVDDQTGSPTATKEVAAVIAELSGKESPPQGIFHFAADDYASRYEIGCFIFEKLGITAGVTHCKTSEYPSKAARPLNSRFNCDKISKILDAAIKPWPGPLEKFLEQL